jgi:hypothetical protein
MMYANLVLHFGKGATSEGTWFVLPLYVDLNACFRMLAGGDGRTSLILLFIVTLAALPLLFRSWWKAGRSGINHMDLSWPVAIVWSMTINLYMAIYDTVLIVIAILMVSDVLRARTLRGYNPRSKFHALLVFVCVTSWLSPLPLSANSAVQIYSFSLVGLGVYILYGSWKELAPPPSGLTA